MLYLNGTTNATFFDGNVWKILTSESAMKTYQSTTITLFIILILGPTVGPIIHGILWHGVGFAICAYYFIKHKITKNPLDLERIRKVIFVWWRFLAKVFYSYSSIGVENIPETPTLIVTLHGTFPIHIVCDAANTWDSHSLLKFRKFPGVIMDRRQCTTKGVLGLYQKVLNLNSWTREELVEQFQKGYDIIVTPGGINDVWKADEYYRLKWGNRIGFADVAIRAKVPIILGFTRNIQEAFRLPWYLEVYAKRKLNLSHVVSSVFSGLPVKLTTFYSKPIPYDENITASELAEKARNGLQQFIDEHQRIPGSIIHAVLERLGIGGNINNRTKFMDRKNTENNNKELTQPLITPDV